MQFDLYWSPEGRKIATVEASNRQKAVRKTPKPYNKALGEVYATNAFVAHICLWSEGFLLGGVRQYNFSPFACESDAVAFAEQSVAVNLDRPGYRNAIIDYYVGPVYSSNPIPAVE